MTHIFPPWFLLSICIIYFGLLFIVFLVYGAILVRFRNSKKKLKELKKEQDKYVSPRNVKFYRKYQIFSKRIQSKNIEKSNGIFILRTQICGKYTEGDFNIKRRSSSILRGLNVLVSHVRAATYVLVIVTVYLVTWMPFFIFCIHKSFFSIESVGTMKNFKTFGENLTQLETCLAFALQEQTCEIEVNEMIEMDVIIKHIFESEQTIIFLE